MAKPILPICDEPTRDLDVGAREAIFALIDSLSREGVAMTVNSSDQRELLTLSHRLMVVSYAAAAGLEPQRR